MNQIIVAISLSSSFFFGCRTGGSFDSSQINESSLSLPVHSEQDLEEFQFCEKQSAGKNYDGEKVIFCEKAFSTRPFVKLPPDQIGSGREKVLYASSTMMNGADTPSINSKPWLVDDAVFLVDRAGNQFGIINPVDGQMFTYAQEVYDFPALAKLISARSAYTIFEVQGVVGKKTLASGSTINTIKISKVRPVVLLNGDLIDNSLLGVYEGTIPLLHADWKTRSLFDRYDMDNLVKIRLKFASIKSPANRDLRNFVVPQNSSSEPKITLTDHSIHMLSGSIENFTKNIKGSDGECIESLRSFGARNPFQSIDSSTPKKEAQLYRRGNMHGDDLQYMLIMGEGTPTQGGGMLAPNTMFHPINFMIEKPPKEFGQKIFGGHHSPNNFFIEIRKIEAVRGGGSCR